LKRRTPKPSSDIFFFWFIPVSGDGPSLFSGTRKGHRPGPISALPQGNSRKGRPTGPRLSGRCPDPTGPAAARSLRHRRPALSARSPKPRRALPLPISSPLLPRRRRPGSGRRHRPTFACPARRRRLQKPHHPGPRFPRPRSTISVTGGNPAELRGRKRGRSPSPSHELKPLKKRPNSRSFFPSSAS